MENKIEIGDKVKVRYIEPIGNAYVDLTGAQARDELTSILIHQVLEDLASTVWAKSRAHTLAEAKEAVESVKIPDRPASTTNRAVEMHRDGYGIGLGDMKDQAVLAITALETPVKEADNGN